MSSPTNWFTAEIQQMMFGFGDSRRPLHETSVLVEEIVHQQMVSMIYQATEVASARGEKGVAMEDILFLLRHDKNKLKRLLCYLEVRDLKSLVKGSMAGGDDKVDANTFQFPDKSGTERRQLGKTAQACHDFLAQIDQTGELLALMDDREPDVVKHERMLRAELQAQGLDTQQYVEFCQARQANFSRRYNKSQRFRDWLQLNAGMEVNFSAMTLELFSYLAYETVAQIVDLALLVKQDTRVRVEDPLSRTRPSLCINYQDLQASSNYSKGEGAAAGGANQSPPSDSSTTANTAATAAAPGNATQTTATAQATTRPTGKKKRKRSGPQVTMEQSWDSTILPSDVREAMRRYYQDIGPFASQMKTNPRCSPWHKTLCS